MVLLPFKDRKQAGELLARVLEQYRGRTDLVVVGLPRGGVPVAAVIAEELGVPLDVMIVRKLGTPGHEELAMGAIAGGGIRVLNEEVLAYLRIHKDTIEAIASRERVELERREHIYRGNHERICLKGRTVILVDDGLATGTTMMAAVQAAHLDGAGVLVVAVPVAPPDTIHRLCRVADEVVCLRTPEPFSGVGLWYTDFSQTSDEEVVELLQYAWARSNESKNNRT